MSCVFVCRAACSASGSAGPGSPCTRFHEQHPSDNIPDVCSNAVRLCLYEKHVAFKFHGVRLVVPDGDFGNLRRAYLRVNPGGIVPTLVHEGRPVYESRRCLDYVDEVMPGKSLVPRAVAEAVGAWCDRCAVEGHGDFAPESANRSLGSCAMTLGAPLEAALAQDVGANALRRGLFQGRRRWPLLLLSLKRWGPNFVAKMPNLMMALKTALEGPSGASSTEGLARPAGLAAAGGGRGAAARGRRPPHAGAPRELGRR